MGPIPEEILQKTWEEVVGFGPDRAKKEFIVSVENPFIVSY